MGFFVFIFSWVVWQLLLFIDIIKKYNTAIGRNILFFYEKD